MKSATNDILDVHDDKFGTDYEENKQSLMQVVDIPSKKLRNIIAGYITRLKKQQG